MTEPLQILGRRADFVAVDKPPEIPTEPAPRFSACLIGLLAAELDCAPESLHAVNRLDVGVSGVVLVATSSEARREAQRLRAAGRFHRRYVGIVQGAPEPAAGVFSASIGRIGPRRVAGGPGAEPARTTYATVARAWEHALVAFELLTGRTHQIRIHAAHGGNPVALDRRYGAASHVVLRSGAVVQPRRIGLFAARLRLDRAEGAWTVTAPPPREMDALWTGLGGDSLAFEAALRVVVPSPAHTA